MELKILSQENVEKGRLKLPGQFNEKIRPDLIKRAVLVIQSNKRQPYGADPRAGKRASAILSKRRRKYRGMYGHGISRTPRKIMSRRGTQFNWEGAFAPQTVGGRRAHPPKTEKIWKKKINKKERRKAVRSALAATMDKDLVSKKHKMPDNYPFILEDKFESIDKTSKLRSVLEKLGLKQELKRGSKKTIRPGKGKARGRKYKKKKSVLIVVSKNCKLLNSAKNIPGIDIEKVNNLNAELLAPGTVPGRLTLFTESSIKCLEKENLFM